MSQETSTLSPFEELVVVKGAMELGFVPANVIVTYLEKFYEASKNGISYSLLNMLVETAGLSESQMEFLKDGVQEDRENNQLPAPINVQSRQAVEKFLGFVEKSAMSKMGALETSKMAAVLQTRSSIKPVNVTKNKNPTHNMVSQQDVVPIRSLPAATKIPLQPPSNDPSSDTVSISCPDCHFKYRIRRTTKSNKFKCIQCKISFYVIPKNPSGNSPQDWIITKSLPENVFATKTVDFSSLGQEDEKRQESFLEDVIGKVSVASRPSVTAVSKKTAVSTMTTSLKPTNNKMVVQTANPISHKTTGPITNSTTHTAAVSTIKTPAPLGTAQQSLAEMKKNLPKPNPLGMTQRNHGSVHTLPPIDIQEESIVAAPSKPMEMKKAPAKPNPLGMTQRNHGISMNQDSKPPQRYENMDTIEISAPDREDVGASNAEDLLNITTTLPDMGETSSDINSSTMELDIRGTSLFKTMSIPKKDEEYKDIPSISTKEVANKTVQELTSVLDDTEAAAIVRHAFNYELITNADVKKILDEYYAQYEQGLEVENLATILIVDGYITKYQYATLRNYVYKDKALKRLPSCLDILDRQHVEYYLGVYEIKKSMKITCPHCQARFVARINVNGGKFKCGKCQKKFFAGKPKEE